MCRLTLIFCGLLVSGLLVLGCEKEEVKTAVDKASKTAESAKDAAAGAVSAASEQAQKLLEDAMNYIKENKLDLAEKTIKQLEGMKDSLPEGLKDGLEKAKSALATAKAAVGGQR